MRRNFAIYIFLLTLSVVLVIGCYGQTNDVKKPPIVAKTDSLTRDTKFLSIGDVYRIYETLGDKITVKDGKTFEGIMQAILNQAVQEYYDKQKQPKK